MNYEILLLTPMVVLTSLEIGTSGAGCCERGNKPVGSTKSRQSPEGDCMHCACWAVN
jgi:hypothetical protein